MDVYKPSLDRYDYAVVTAFPLSNCLLVPNRCAIYHHQSNYILENYARSNGDCPFTARETMKKTAIFDLNSFGDNNVTTLDAQTQGRK
jgi:hypothetical protein